jgi:hypothetical protein
MADKTARQVRTTFERGARPEKEIKALRAMLKINKQHIIEAFDLFAQSRIGFESLGKAPNGHGHSLSTMVPRTRGTGCQGWSGQ